MTQHEPVLPFSDIRIVSFAQLLQGPSGVQILADLGADVIKVERPKVGAWERSWSGAETYINGVSAFFLLFNRNQRSLTVDLKSPLGKEIIIRLIKTADVLVENYRPGVMDRLGLGYEDLKTHNPRLIYCSCSGYGSDGPYRDRPGQDLLAQSMSGLAAMTGKADDPPIPAGGSVIDQHAAVLLALSIMAALWQRQHTQQGQKVELNLLNAAMDLQVEAIGYFLNGGQVTQRSRSGLATTYHQPPYGIYKTRDGYLCLSMTPLEKLATVLQAEELRQWREEDRFPQRDAINEVIRQHLQRRTTAEWLEIFRAADIWCAEVYDYPALFADPQVQHNDVVGSFEYPGAGTIRFLKHPARYSAMQPSVRRPPPQLGEHTTEILQELGYSAQEIDDFQTKGVV
ncbi:MAG: CoA transferase [Nitrospinota bacterium]|nr:MAG: CoA transferase [Nitrospinota bacterium]